MSDSDSSNTYEEDYKSESECSNSSEFSITYDEDFESDNSITLQYYRYCIPSDSDLIDKHGNMIFSKMTHIFDCEYHIFNRKYLFYFKETVHWYKGTHVYSWDLDFNEEKKEFEVWDFGENKYPVFYNAKEESFYFMLDGVKIGLWVDQLFTNFCVY